MKEIKLTQGKVALVDDEDYEKVNCFKWNAIKDRNTFYAKRNIKVSNGLQRQTTIQMQRLIFGYCGILKIDHRDGNGLNNQKSNLRFATTSQNGMNRKPNKCALSKFKGVSFHKRHLKFISSIRINGNSYHLGYFTNEIEAAKAYDVKALELFGEFAYLNFPS